MATIYIGYGSETGNAENLAKTLAQHLSELNLDPQLSALNDIALNTLQNDDVLFIVTSNFGDGEAPGNATKFYESLQECSKLACQYAVFGLGDVSYPKFCGFTKDLDNKLATLGATRIANRVDADTSYREFFKKWLHAVTAYFKGEKSALTELNLQVKAYGANQTFKGKIAKITRVNQGEFPVYDIEIDIRGSNMCYDAGDLLYLVPPTNMTTLKRIHDFYGHLTEKELELLHQKELRLLSKSLFRALAKKTNNETLKALTKISAAKEFNQYIYGRDIADVLIDFCDKNQVSVAEITSMLPDKLPRAYSIASDGQVSSDYVRLCVREVQYHLNEVEYHGTASGFLCHTKEGDDVDVYVRANAHFHLPKDETVPVIMIGAGTGIAPYLGFLQSDRQGEMHLFFGERYKAKDFLYQNLLEHYLQEKRLTSLHTAFSRDQDEKIYVQHILHQQMPQLWELFQKGAHIYVCGSKANLGKPIDEVFLEMAKKYGNLDDAQSQQWLYDLVSTERYHKDLY